MSVLLVTSLGDVVIDLFTDDCPLTCKSFLKLAKINYYNGCLFHNVQNDFIAQTGDPTGTGTGGDSIYKFLYGDQARFFEDEIHPHPLKQGYSCDGKNLNASQFYITLRDDIRYLHDKHTVFGNVAEGLDVVEKINQAYVDDKGRPLQNIRIKNVYVLFDPFEDSPCLVTPQGKQKEEVEVYDDDVRLEDDWVPMDESLAPHELDRVIRAKEARSRGVVLECIGDIPDADTKPPENQLFVCRLNPITEEDDLHTIFSRFGAINSVIIVRDKNGDSFGFGFIEFESKVACEQAYYAMDGTLIDDRRIRVDFSQSAYKEWHKFRFKRVRANDSSNDQMTRSRSLRPKRNHRSFVHKATMGGQRVSSHGRIKGQSRIEE